MQSATPHIAVIGAGPAGLTFASVLLHQWSSLSTPAPHLTIYERDTARESRDQGGTLDLHRHTGQRALELAGLLGAFKRVARYEGDAIRVLDKTGKVWVETEAPQDIEELEKKPGGSKPEIDRGVLKALLAESLPEGTINWGCSVMKLTPSDTGKYIVSLADGSDEEFDLVVAGDGAWSKARKLLSDVMPQYSGIHMFEAKIADVDAKHPQIATLVGQGSMMAFSDNKSIVAQRNSGSRIRIYFGVRCPSDFITTSGIDFSTLSAARPAVHSIFSDWASEFLDLLDKGDDPADGSGIIPRAIYELPPDTFEWQHKQGLTLVGDAAHLMSPFAGEGANMAMADGVELAEAIVEGAKQESGDWLDTAVKKYEKGMFPRATESMKKTQVNLEAFMHEDAPASGLKYMQEMWQSQSDEETAATGTEVS